MEVFVILVFNKETYPSTTEYVTVKATREEAEDYVNKHKKEYGWLQELYFESVKL